MLSLHCLFLPPPQVSGDANDSPMISSLLLPTCMVCEGDSSRHRIGLLPIGFIPPILCHSNSIVFNLVFSFSSFVYIASRFLWSRYSYDTTKHCYVKCLWVIGRFKRDRYYRVASVMGRIRTPLFTKSWVFGSSRIAFLSSFGEL
jgi:hypothetical protein